MEYEEKPFVTEPQADPTVSSSEKKNAPSPAAVRRNARGGYQEEQRTKRMPPRGDGRVEPAAKARQAAVHTCVGVTLVTHWSHSTLLRVCVCAVRVSE